MTTKREAPRVVTLDELHEGAALEMWQDALDQVLANAVDPNTAHRDVRRIRLDVDFRVNEERNVADVELTCSTKLAGRRGVASLVYLGKHEGQTIAVEQPRQDELFPAPGGELVTIPGGKDSA